MLGGKALEFIHGRKIPPDASMDERSVGASFEPPIT